MYIIMFVLDEHQKLDPLLEAWEKAGITGVTIIESTGIQRRRQKKRVLGMRNIIAPVGTSDEKGNYTLMTIVQDESLINACIEATEAVVGDLYGPDTGVLAAWPLTHSLGVPKQQTEGDND